MNDQLLLCKLQTAITLMDSTLDELIQGGYKGHLMEELDHQLTVIRAIENTYDSIHNWRTANYNKRTRYRDVIKDLKP